MNLIFDAPQATHRAFNRIQLSHNGQPTEIIYGVLTSALRFVNQFKPDKIIYCWDSKYSSRKILDSRYKANRLKDPFVYTSLWHQETQLKDIFKQIGWNHWEVEGLEADDLVANISFIEHTDAKNIDNIIVSTDQDLYQLLSPSTALYFPTQNFLFTMEEFIEKFKILPFQWVMVKAIEGCTGDNVIGIFGIGTKRAIDYLLHGKKSRQYQKIQEAKNIWKHNLKLVTLPLRFSAMPEFKPLSINMNALISIAEFYNFKSILKSPEKWDDAFNKQQ